MSVEHNIPGPGGPDASGSEHLHLLGGPWDPENSMLSDPRRDVWDEYLAAYCLYVWGVNLAA